MHLIDEIFLYCLIDEQTEPIYQIKRGSGTQSEPASGMHGNPLAGGLYFFDMLRLIKNDYVLSLKLEDAVVGANYNFKYSGSTQRLSVIA